MSRALNLNDLSPIMTMEQVAFTHLLDLLDMLGVISMDCYIDTMMLLDERIADGVKVPCEWNKK